MGQAPRKRFGQHFLKDEAVIASILDAIDPKPGERFVEIGPGYGAITVPLLGLLGELHVIELDRDLIPKLQLICQSKGKLIVHQGDALRFVLASLSVSNRRLRVVGNLPYNISTQFMFHMLKQIDSLFDMHFMLQKDVVQRLNASPGSKEYGRLSVMVQFKCHVVYLFDVDPSCFTPQPAVQSAMVRLLPYSQPPVLVQDEVLFARVVRQAFSQRRKTIRNALNEFGAAIDWQTLKLSPQLRAEELSLEQFAMLSDHIHTTRETL